MTTLAFFLLAHPSSASLWPKVFLAAVDQIHIATATAGAVTVVARVQRTRAGKTVLPPVHFPLVSEKLSCLPKTLKEIAILQ